MVLYFMGTGNSRYLARRIAEGLEMLLYDLNACIKAGDTAPVNPVFYCFFVKADAFRATDACIGYGRCVELCPLNNVHLKKRKAGLGQKLHPLHGVHLLLPQRGHRVRRKEQRQAPVSR